MRRLLWTAGTMLAALALTACPGTPPATDTGPGQDVQIPTDNPTPSDGGVDARDVSNPTDVPTVDVPSVDSPETGSGTLGPCRSNADCSSVPGSICLDHGAMAGFPGGVCTKQCTSDRQCPSNGICEENNGICLPRCSEGGGECDQYSGLCFIVDPTDDTRRACFSSCYPTGSVVPTTVPVSCDVGQTCDPYGGGCMDPGDTLPTGSDNGGPCVSDTDCKGGRCIPEVDPATGPSGFVGGYCFSVGRQIEIQDYDNAIGGRLPESNCPAGSPVLPDDPNIAGEPTICWGGCDATHPCRGGYDCYRFPQPDAGDLFTSGVCFPINCNEAPYVGQPRNGCPVGASCQLQPADDAGDIQGLCVTDVGG